MNWLFSRRKPKGKPIGPTSLITGCHRSPGLSGLTAELKHRSPESVLDLGASSSENLAFLTRFTDNVSILDIASLGTMTQDNPKQEGRATARRDLRGSGQRRTPQAPPLRIAIEEISLESADGPFDLILMWDLLHYIERGQVASFVTRLAKSSRPGTLVHMLASGATAIPTLPVRFRIQDSQHLLYEVLSEERLPAPGFTVREVENLMQGFEPVRFFQLRNGLQEFLFRYRGDTRG
jgi:hypothetical protein